MNSSMTSYLVEKGESHDFGQIGSSRLIKMPRSADSIITFQRIYVADGGAEMDGKG